MKETKTVTCPTYHIYGHEHYGAITVETEPYVTIQLYAMLRITAQIMYLCACVRACVFAYSIV